MHFANPGFLWALSLLIVPVIIHLFKFRKYRKVYFPNIKFLKRINEEQRANRRLKDILILLSRMIVTAALVIAFARPFIGNEGQLNKGNAISVYIDNSFSMENETEKGVLIDLARKKAEELALSFQPSDRFQLITNNMEARHQRWVDQQAFLQFLYEVDLSPSVIEMSKIYTRQKDLIQKDESFRSWVVFISDFQKSSADLTNISSTEDEKIRLLPLRSSERQNLFIDSVWFETPVRQIGLSETLHFRVVNQSDKVLDEVPVRLEINGQLKTMANIMLKPFRSLDTLIHFTNNVEPGYQDAILKISDSPIIFDDNYYFTYQLKDRIRVSEVYEQGVSDNYAVLFNDSLFNFARLSVKQIDLKKLAYSDMIVLNGLNKIPSGLASFLTNWIKEGGNLLVSPGVEIDENEYNRFFTSFNASIALPVDTHKTRVSEIEIRDGLYNGVFESMPKGRALPNISKHYLINIGDLEWRILLHLPAGDFLLAVKNSGGGKIFLTTVPIDNSWGNWSRHALFVTTVLRIAEQSIHTPIIEHTIGDHRKLALYIPDYQNDGATQFELKADDGSLAFIPSQHWKNGKLNLQINDEIKKAGFYSLTSQEEQQASIAFNYSRKESIMEFLSPDDLDAWVGEHEDASVLDVQNKIIRTNMVRDEKPLWKFFMLTALIFLIFEILIIKVMK